MSNGEVEGVFEFDSDSGRERRPGGFDASLLQESLSVLHTREPILLSPDHTVTEAMRAMQSGHQGCVLITKDGTRGTPLVGLFTERDVLFRIVDRGRNPATLRLAEVMTPDPETVPLEANIAWVLNRMSVGGFRHVPVVDREGRPVLLVSVRDVVDFLVAAFPREVLNLPTEFGADRTRSREGA